MKARRFVFSLRDYFQARFDNPGHYVEGPPGPGEATPEAKSSTMNLKHEEWTLEYINVTRLQPIIEAFDDDASGFITVSEVNALTTSKPDKWR